MHHRFDGLDRIEIDRPLFTAAVDCDGSALGRIEAEPHSLADGSEVASSA